MAKARLNVRIDETQKAQVVDASTAASKKLSEWVSEAIAEKLGLRDTDQENDDLKERLDCTQRMVEMVRNQREKWKSDFRESKENLQTARQALAKLKESTDNAHEALMAEFNRVDTERDMWMEKSSEHEGKALGLTRELEESKEELTKLKESTDATIADLNRRLNKESESLKSVRDALSQIVSYLGAPNTVDTVDHCKQRIDELEQKILTANSNASDQSSKVIMLLDRNWFQRLFNLIPWRDEEPSEETEQHA